MNRAVDYRTDFYSLGATFYQMLTGKLPFTTSDALELVHCHIAKNPVPPHQVCAEIPIAVSDIVMKLMAKTAEDRYQSALGLKQDLEICWRQLELNGEIAHLTPGKLDQSGQFLIPQKLYGRVNEVRSLLEAFNRVSAGSSELMLVSGYSGIGKTSVVNEVHKAIVQQRGYFIAGKFDELKRNIPYAALIQACQTPIEQLLTETDEEIERWKQALLAALEGNGQALIDVIPEVEHIIGSQPSIPQLDAAATQNRFNRVFQQFIRAFAKSEHPLVVFLDDLQWADSASLKLIQNILCDGDTHHLLLIGAERDNEVSPTHPTVIAIKNIEQAGAIVNHILLQPLSLAHASELMCDTLGESLKFEGSSSADGLGVRMRSLMRLACNKTQGNPFFLTQLLQTLHSEQLLDFDFDRGEWTWELEQIQAVGITDLNVVELVARNIQRLSEETQQVLKLAACMGHQFNLDTLTIISEQSIINTADKLWEALEAGLILPLSQAYKIPMFVDDAEQKKWQFDALGVTYKFLHDRIQQAAYSLIPDEQKKTTHLKIGQLLLQKTPESAIEDNIFDIVNQLNIGVELITNSAEKERLAALNLIAGRKAKAATAYEAAVRYLSVGLGLLTASSWQCNYDITLNLHVEAVEAEYITTHYDRAKQLADIVLENASDPLEKVKVYETIVQFYIDQNRMPEAITTAIAALKLLGVSLPEQPSKLGILADSMRTKLTINSVPRQIRGNEREELATLPEMTDPYKIAAMRLLITVLVPAFLSAPNLFPIVTFKMVNLSIKYGNSPQAAYGYALYGWLLCGGLGDIATGYRFGQLALKLVSQFDTRELKCKVINIVNAFIRHWKEHGSQTIPAFVEALQSSLSTGNIEYAGYSSINYCHYTFLIGEELEQVSTAQQPYIDLMQKLKQEYALHSVSTVGQTVLNLLGESAHPCQLVGDRFDEETMLPAIQSANVMTSLFMIYFYKSMLLYLFKQYNAAVENAALAEKYTPSILGFMTLAVHNFYYSLA